MNDPHEQNRACWNAWADWWREMADRRGSWKRCRRDPGLVLSAAELHYLEDIRGRDVCVLASGDNEVVFALAGLGAAVTSVDISERQLEIAAERAGILGLNVAILRADVTDLSALSDDRFDLVYTGGHACVWVSDITRYYAEAVRVLRPGGVFLGHEYHPVRRMWHESDGSGPRYRYLDRGPHEYETNEGLTQVEFHWTTADHVQAVRDAGCDLTEVLEHGDGGGDPEYAAFVPPALPMYLMIAGVKPGCP